MNIKNNVSAVVESKLCNTCGACFAICPKTAIDYNETVGGYFFPKINSDLCVNCGLCFKVCPGINFCNSLMNEIPKDPFVGNVIKTYVGKSTNKALFNNSQSGGIVSAILANAFETGKINSAITVIMEEGSPPSPKVKIAKNTEDLFNSQKSKYCPVPILTALKDIESIDTPLAIVGLPCHIHGLKNLIDAKPKLKNKIAFTVGLLCERIMTLSSLDFFLSYLPSKNIKEEDCIINYKDKSISGYPGDVHVFSEDKYSTKIKSKVRIQIKDYFTPARCRICFDKMNVFSDLTFGDPHGINDVDRKRGETIAIIRSKVGMSIFESFIDSKAIDVRPILLNDIITGQRIRQKRQDWAGYINVWGKTFTSIPNYSQIVKEFALKPLLSEKKYNNSLQWSINLDKFQSRNNLIRYIKYVLWVRSVKNFLLIPKRLSKRLIKFLKSTKK